MITKEVTENPEELNEKNNTELQNIKTENVLDTGEKISLMLKNLSPRADTVYLKLVPDSHPLSAEQQIFFLKITEAIYGYNEQIRNENLRVLSTDYNVKYLLPYLSQFIQQTVHLNIVLTDLTLLIYTVRMTKSILSNKHLYLLEYLHEILPAILSCALAKKISKYYSDNHWTLRDFSAYIVAVICQRYTTNLNNITNRVINIYQKPLKENVYPLTTIYGAIKGLGSLGEEPIKTALLPNIINISKQVQIVFEKSFPLYSDERGKQLLKEAKHVKDAIVMIVSPILLKTKNANDGGLLYVKHFGYLGRYLYAEVKNLERMEMENQKYQIGNGYQGSLVNYNFQENKPNVHNIDLL